METTEGYDPRVWRQMAKQLGLQGLAIPEEFGGQGFSFVELGVVARGNGPRSAARPFFGFGGTGGQRVHAVRRSRRRKRGICRASHRATPLPRWR